MLWCFRTRSRKLRTQEERSALFRSPVEVDVPVEDRIDDEEAYLDEFKPLHGYGNAPVALEPVLGERVAGSE